jgi:hypothetical protein
MPNSAADCVWGGLKHAAGQNLKNVYFMRFSGHPKLA